MTTRAELRTALRQRLEDAGAGPLWDDATLNDALAGALRAYGARFPKEAVVSVVVAAGATRVPVAAPVVDPARIVRVLDGAGAVVPRQAEAPDGAIDPGTTPGRHRTQAWRWWDATLVLAQPATAGSWQIEHLTTRAVPTDDVGQLDLLPGDEELLLLLATATALRRRATEDAKRGIRSAGIAALAEAARAEVARLIGARRRRARGGWLG